MARKKLKGYFGPMYVLLRRGSESSTADLAYDIAILNRKDLPADSIYMGKHERTKLPEYCNPLYHKKHSALQRRFIDDCTIKK